MNKPLGHKSYGTIAHLPGSRQGRDDIGINPGHARICLEKPRDKHDRIIVQEKLDGSNVAVANIEGKIVALGRSGHTAWSSKYEQHRLFAWWVDRNPDRFDFLNPGERLCGEWIALAHGTIYADVTEPFYAFDIMRNGHVRACYGELVERVNGRVPIPTSFNNGTPIPIKMALVLLGDRGHHGATESIEGAVWRVERSNTETVDYLAKYVQPGKVDGKYLPEVSDKPAVWNWLPKDGWKDLGVTP